MACSAFFVRVMQYVSANFPAQASFYMQLSGECLECFLRIAHKYVPRVLLGFPISDCGGRSSAAVVQFMKKLGTDQADFVVLPSSDQDAASRVKVSKRVELEQESDGRHKRGTKIGSHFFKDCLDEVNFYHEAMRGLPVLLWRTSLGVPPEISGQSLGTDDDSQTLYFLAHSEELIAARGIGIVFSVGENGLTGIKAVDEPFRISSCQYLANRASLLEMAINCLGRRHFSSVSELPFALALICQFVQLARQI